MNGRWLGLCGALIVTASLASCSAGEMKNGADMLKNTGMSASGYRTSGTGTRKYLPDSQYYADSAGTVKRYRPAGSSDWEQLGQALEEGWNELMKGAEDTVKKAGKDTKKAAQDIGRGVENAAGTARDNMTGK